MLEFVSKAISNLRVADHLTKFAMAIITAIFVAPRPLTLAVAKQDSYAQFS